MFIIELLTLKIYVKEYYMTWINNSYSNQEIRAVTRVLVTSTGENNLSFDISLAFMENFLFIFF